MTRSRRRTVIVSVVALCLVLAAGGAGAVLLLQPADAAPVEKTAAPSTAVIERGVLSQSARLDGTVGFGTAAPVSVKADGIITELPAVGAQLDRGSVALRANERAVPVLIGDVPLYRAVDGSGLKGADISMVAANLMELGHLRRSDPATFTTGPQFAEAVRDWQESLDLERTGALGPADVIVLSAPSRIAAVSARPGDPAAGQPFTVTATARIVEASVPAQDAGAVGAGARATIELPDGRTVEGSLVTVTTTGEGIDAKVQAVVSIDDQAAVDGIDAAAVTVRVVTRSVEDVLFVPVASLVALAEGGYALQDEEGALHGVEIGLIADDLVEVNGAGIDAGMTVVTAK
ncbi:peptidoglycan-binding protein [Microbacterium sp. ANT_H45B]|uniref:peptidoglycan-binding protein n=1 Tax=Microbacterium sp. ANT_H45B TaxID=2597346 RepID=UPI00165E63E0|nr:peptidoglycan-binding protein [Microbacterium sp. ANT_H45B]